MTRLIALLLLISMLFGLCACAAGGKDNGEKPTDGNAQGGGGNEEEVIDPSSVIVVPEYKDYGRGTVNFDELIYSRPNIQSVIDKIDAVTIEVTENERTVSEQIASISALESAIETVETMYSLTEIYRSKDSSVEFWQIEYGYISVNYPKLSQAIENLLEACAASEHRQTFEKDYFDYSLEDYANGGIYTDEVVRLMEEEARLEAEYSSLSTATVEIVYDSVASTIRWEGTADEVYAMAREHFKNDDASYERVCMAINLLYEKKYMELSIPIYVDLFKVRRLIADELGYSSYADLAYKTLGYDYTADKMLALLKDVGAYVSPVASELEASVFGSYFQKNAQPQLKKAILINNLYEVYSELGGDYKDAYSYMLQHKLYDISGASNNRFAGAFTAYISNNSSPYLYMNASGFVRDYGTLSHEFGHFLDGYINYGNNGSLTISEVSSQTLELLTLLKLKGRMTSADYQYLEYHTTFIFLNSVLMIQSFYSAFEHLAYSLDYDDITEAKLKSLVEDAFTLVYGDEMSIEGDLSYVTLTHTVLYPFYVESYVTSGLVSLDIFFKERYGNGGEGFALYEALINRGDTDLSLTERLEAAGLDSPFTTGKVKKISNSIYFAITGKNRYKDSDNFVDAA